MRVRELMSTNIACCGPMTNAASIAEILWSRDCGSVPVVDEKNRILGIVTDRDLFIALGTRNCHASSLAADEVMSRNVVTCSPDDDVKRAVALMEKHQVRRIPVVDKERAVRGLVSIYDAIRHSAAQNGSGELSHASVIQAMARIAERPAPKQASLLATR
ncbi:CBS domain-containing protein [bacterium]|nr:CBS domain-containing protein [bacterium]